MSAGAYWLKRSLDKSLVMAGDGRLGLYEAKARWLGEMKLALYGVELRHMGQFTSSKHAAVAVMAEAGTRVKLEKCALHALQGPGVSITGAPASVALDNNVCAGNKNCYASAFFCLGEMGCGMEARPTPPSRIAHGIAVLAHTLREGLI
jgi:hypothetical protein